MKNVYNIILLSSLSLGLVACNGTNSGDGGKSKVQNELQTSSTYSYDFSYNGCKTGKKTFDSLENLCTALQDNDLNNSCALEFRENYFNRHCPGKQFEPFSTNQTDASIDVLNNFQVRKLDLDEVTMDVPKTSPERTLKPRSALSPFSCVNSFNDGAHTQSNGFTLLKKSKAVINRDLNYRFGDGTNASKFNPQVLFSCASDADSSTETAASIIGVDFQEKTLQVGHAVMEVVVVSPPGIQPAHSELTYISCSQNALDAAASGLNGLGLLKGSTVIIKRDTNYVFGDGTNASDLRPISVISCE